MKIIKAGYEFITPINREAILKRIEEVGRVCYKSEDKITDESAPKFVKMLIERGHEAMIEHCSFSVKFICDRGVSHELVRHRIASFAQESTRYCVAGDTRLTFKNPHVKMTISELYDNIQNSTNGAWKRLNIKQLNEDTGELVFGNINNVFMNGVKECFTLTTELGYELTCTEDHEILTECGYVPLNKLCVGDSIYVNGHNIPATDLYKDHDWLYYQNIKLNKTFVQIAEEFNFNASTLKKWARKLNIPKKGTGYFNEGRESWNKGLYETDDIRIQKQANALREYHYDNSKKGQTIMKENTSKYQKHMKYFCEICGSMFDLEVHHKDKNRGNNNPTNLLTCCESCHARTHSNNLEVIYLDKIVDIKLRQDMPVYDIEMQGNFHNYVADGIVVHNCNYSKDKFGNEITVVAPCFLDFTADNSRHGTLYLDEKTNHWEALMSLCEKTYFKLLELGASPQEARAVLPNSLKTEIVVTMNMREWRHFFKLRTANAAHPQMREITVPLLNELKGKLPEIFEDIEII